MRVVPVVLAGAVVECVVGWVWTMESALRGCDTLGPSASWRLRCRARLQAAWASVASKTRRQPLLSGRNEKDAHRILRDGASEPALCGRADAHDASECAGALAAAEASWAGGKPGRRFVGLDAQNSGPLSRMGVLAFYATTQG